MDELTLTADELAIILPDLCDLARDTTASDGRLGQTATTVTTAGVRCRVKSLGEGRAEREAELAGAIRSANAYVVRLPIGTDVRAKDRVLWRGLTLEVSGLLERSFETVRSVLCTRV